MKGMLYYHCFLTLIQDMRLGMSKKGQRETELERSTSASDLGRWLSLMGYNINIVKKSVEIL